MASIFISHSSEDKSFVRKLKNDLVQLGHNVWVDEGQIDIGDSIPLKYRKDYLMQIICY